MYCEYFGLRDYPFLSTADRRFFYLSEGQSKAREYLKYLLVIRDGIVVVTGEPGVGKTVLLEQAIHSLPEKVYRVYLNQTLVSVDEFLLAICSQLNCAPERKTRTELFAALHDFAMEQHLAMRPVLLIIDEAQNLNPLVLEQVRLLANLEMFGRKLIQIILAGQPELSMNISALPNDAFEQLIRLHHRVEPLSREEVCEYIDYRLYVAGNDGRLMFPRELMDGILCYSGGVPRLINQLCDMMLVTAYINKTTSIDNKCLHHAIHKLHWPLYLERKSEFPLTQPKQDYVDLRPLPILVVKKGDVVVGKYLLNRKRMLIGRQKNLDIYIDEPLASRIHAQIVYLDQQFFIHDLNSLHGIHNGDGKVKWYSLSDHDRLRIGGHTLEYQLSDEVIEVPTLDVFAEESEAAAIA